MLPVVGSTLRKEKIAINCGAFLKVFITAMMTYSFVRILRLLIAFFEEKILYTHFFHKLYNMYTIENIFYGL